MFSVGLTGGIGSGKTTVADMLGKLGASIVDTDLIAHGITAPGGAAMAAIEQRFGPEFLAPDGSLNRAPMRALVFGNEAARRKLEAITHPLIRAETERAAQAATGPYVVFVVPLLVESGSWRSRVSRVLVVDCSVETQIARVMQRNGFTRAEVEAIIARQATRKARLAAAGDVVLNENQPRAALKTEVAALHERYLAYARAAGP